MAFGQQSGPPATAKQLQELLTLLRTAGHEDFRDARGPMGFTQRQAGGKFSRDEATAFIDQLEAAQDDGPPPFVATGRRPASAAPSPSSTTPRRIGAAPAPSGPARQALDEVPAEQLADELRRRGWMVFPP